MKVQLPNLNGKEVSIEDKKSIVLIGANGSGKTRMSVWISKNNPDIEIHRISAQKSLTMPENTSPTEIITAQELFLYGTYNEDKEWLKSYGKINGRWGDKPETHLLDDFSYLMQYLITEEYEKKY